MTMDKSVSCIPWRAVTYWTMVNNLTLRSYSTYSRTRVCTFLIAACFILITIRICCTFWSTKRRWSNVICYTWTHSMIVYFSTLTIWSTRRWITWVNLSLNYNNKYKINRRKISKKIFFLLLPSTGLHSMKAFPDIFSGHRHIGIWL